MPSVIELNEHAIEVTHLGKVLFPDLGITKGDVIHYYEHVAETMLPHLKGRPLTMERYPDGIADGGFFQKDTPDYFPEWIPRKRLAKEHGSVRYVVAEDAATLVYLANQGCITPHIWLSQVDSPDHPDRMVFDLDPPEPADSKAQKAARILGNRLREMGLTPFLMATGSRGFHVVVPLHPEQPFDRVREAASTVARSLVDEFPRDLTMEQRKINRKDRVFVDILRNARGQTTVAPYSLRARPGAPVAVPLDWEELRPGLASDHYTLRTLFRRLGQKADPWKSITESRHDLADVEKQLEELSIRDR